MWVSPIHEQCIDIFREIYHRTESLIKSSKNEKEIILITGGRIIFRSADTPSTLRGKGFSLVIFDEMSFAKDGAEEAWKVIRPTLVEKGSGRFLGISTPNGFNYFKTLWDEMEKNSDWYTIQHDYSCSPHLSPEEIAKVRLEMPEGAFRQEFMAQFVQAAGSLFKAEWLQNIFVDEIPMPPQRHVISVDLSLGYLHSDGQAVVYCAWFNGCLYVDCVIKRMPVEELLDFVKAFYLMYKPESVAFETNTFQVLAAHQFQKLFTVPPPVMCVNNKVKKETRIARLGTLLQQGKFKVKNNAGGRTLFAELSDFPNPKQTDDGVDACEQGWRVMIES